MYVCMYYVRTYVCMYVCINRFQAERRRKCFLFVCLGVFCVSFVGFLLKNSYRLPSEYNTDTASEDILTLIFLLAMRIKKMLMNLNCILISMMPKSWRVVKWRENYIGVTQRYRQISRGLLRRNPTRKFRFYYLKGICIIICFIFILYGTGHSPMVKHSAGAASLSVGQPVFLTGIPQAVVCAVLWVGAYKLPIADDY